MPKVKTKSGAKKRFKLTGSGKIKRKYDGRIRHKLVSYQNSPNQITGRDR